MSKKLCRGWYWRVHGKEYKRKSVSREKQPFKGWKFFIDLINECNKTPYYAKGCIGEAKGETIAEMRARLIRRDKALIATAFLAGGRVSETLMLRRKNFKLEDKRIIVEGMPLLKRYVKIGEDKEVLKEKPTDARSKFFHYDAVKDEWRKRRYVTTPELQIRQPFPIPLYEPLTPYLVSWLEETKDFLFPTEHNIPRYRVGKDGKPIPILETNKGVEALIKTPAKTDEVGGLGVNRRMWIHPVRAYQIVRGVGERLNTHIWDHWFRAQRASQLAEEYEFTTDHLNRFFGWVGVTVAGAPPTADFYAHLSVEYLWRMMSPSKIKYDKLEAR